MKTTYFLIGREVSRTWTSTVITDLLCADKAITGSSSSRLSFLEQDLVGSSKETHRQVQLLNVNALDRADWEPAPAPITS